MKVTSQAILVAEDDEDDRFFIQEAIAESQLAKHLTFVGDGLELLETLNRPQASLPSLILLDLNMPRLNGLAALKQLKASPHLCHIPVVILTTSQAESDIVSTYQLGSCGYLTKPSEFGQLVTMLKQLEEYWFQLVKLPDQAVF